MTEVMNQEPQGFDLRVNVYDPKTGKQVKHQPYRMVVSKEEGTYFIRDGIRYNPDGSLRDKPLDASKVAEKVVKSDKART